MRAAPFVQAIATEGNVEYVAGKTNMMRQQLQWIDNLRDQGKMSRSDAVKWVEQYLSGQVANFEANSKRSGQWQEFHLLWRTFPILRHLGSQDAV